jgi:peptidoglycan/LPS O-acetylase OafA/YrhL
VNIGKSVRPPGSFVPLNHFWTLAVEEQFYVVYPLLLTLVPTRILARLLCIGAIVALLIRVALGWYGSDSTIITQLTPCCLDPLLLGGLMAVKAGRDQTRKLATLMMLAGTLGLVALIGWCDPAIDSSARLLWVFGRAAAALAAAGLIASVVRDSGSPLLRVLRFRPAVAIGAVSYGIYVWHLPIQWLIGESTRKVVDSYIKSDYAQLCQGTILVGTTIGISCMTWRLIEQPLIAWARRVSQVSPT